MAIVADARPLLDVALHDDRAYTIEQAMDAVALRVESTSDVHHERLSLSPRRVSASAAP